MLENQQNGTPAELLEQILVPEFIPRKVLGKSFASLRIITLVNCK